MRRSAPALALAAVLGACASLEPADPARTPPSDYTGRAFEGAAPSPEQTRTRVSGALRAARWIDVMGGPRSKLSGARASAEGLTLALKDATGAQSREFGFAFGQPQPHLQRTKDGGAIVRFAPLYVEESGNRLLRPYLRGTVEAYYDAKSSSAAAGLIDALAAAGAPPLASAPRAPAAEPPPPSAPAPDAPAASPAAPAAPAEPLPAEELARRLERSIKSARAVELRGGGRLRVLGVAKTPAAVELALKDLFGAARRTFSYPREAEAPLLQERGSGAAVLLPPFWADESPSPGVPGRARGAAELTFSEPGQARELVELLGAFRARR